MVPASIRTAVAVGSFALATTALALPISISGVVTGDPRLSATYQDLKILVTITTDTTSNQASWTVDIASPAHPDAKLDEFYFNMGGLAGDYSFSGFNPTGWSISSPASTAGGGSMTPTFMFEALDPAGPPNAADVTNTQDLTFTMTKASGNFTVNDFLNATSSCSSETALGCGQLGAHLQALQQGASGFLLGNYEEGSVPPGGRIPEPSILALLGLAMISAGAARKSKIAG